MRQQIQWSICRFGLRQQSDHLFPTALEDYGAFVFTILTVRVLRRCELLICVLMPFQITVSIQIPAHPSTSLFQHVRIYTKLLRLFELYRPIYALYQNLDGRECEEEMPQSTSRALHRGLGYLQHMSIARTLAARSKRHTASWERLLVSLDLRGRNHHLSAQTMPATLRPRLRAIPSLFRPITT